MKKLFVLTANVLFLLAFCHCSAPSSNDQTPPVPEVKNVILMIGDGMGVTQVYAGMSANKNKLHLERAQSSGFAKTYASNNYVTDSAASGTAIACGTKTTNGTIGLDAEGNVAKSVLEYALEDGMATGIVVTSSVTHATPAAFVAHQERRGMEEEIAVDLVNLGVDVFIGGGQKFFEKRKDEQNLTEQMKAKGYQMVYTLEDVKNTQSGKLGALLADNGMPKYSERGDMLPESVEVALRLLEKNEKGFFLMVEGSQIDSRCHGNDGEGAIGEMLDFDKAIKIAFDYADRNPNTLVVVTADHETGGMSLTGGNFETGEVKAEFATGGHTAVMVPIFAYGPRACDFTGIMENTAIMPKILDALAIER